MSLTMTKAKNAPFSAFGQKHFFASNAAVSLSLV
jgi:hypothetical protein